MLLMPINGRCRINLDFMQCLCRFHAEQIAMICKPIFRPVYPSLILKPFGGGASHSDNCKIREPDSCKHREAELPEDSFSDRFL